MPTSRSLGGPIDPALLAIEAAAEPERIPILDRDSGRVLAVLAAGCRQIVEVGTAYGYSTLWMALAQPRDGRIVTIDPDRARTDLARGWWRSAGVADERITVVNRPALEAFAANEPALARSVRARVHRRPEARIPGLRRGAGAATRAGGPRRRGQRPVERSNVRIAGCRAE